MSAHVQQTASPGTSGPWCRWTNAVVRPLARSPGADRAGSFESFRRAAVLRHDARGASLVEYIILLGVVALLAIGAWRQFSGSVKTAVDREAERVRTLDAVQTGEFVGGGTAPLPGGSVASTEPSPGGGSAFQGPLRSTLPESTNPDEDPERNGGAGSKKTDPARATKLIASVLKAMCPQDAAFLKDLKARGVKVTAVDSIFFADPYFDGTKWTTRPFPAGGTTLNKSVKIAVSSSDDANALTFYHEATHTGQPATMAWRDMEYDAYTKTEQWAIARGLPAHDPSFRKVDAAGNVVVDEAAIRARVDGVYPGVTAAPAVPSAGPEETIGRTKSGKTIVRRADGTQYVRSPKAGDSFPGPEQTKPAQGTPIDMNKLQCP